MTFSEVRLFLLMLCWAALSCQSGPTLCDLMDCSPLGFSVHGILQARILERVAMFSSRGSSQPRDWTQVSWIAGRFFTVWATREAQEYWSAGRFFTSWAARTRSGPLFLVYFPNSVVPKIAAQKYNAVYVNRDIWPWSLTIHNLNLYFSSGMFLNTWIKHQWAWKWNFKYFKHTHTHIHTHTHKYFILR